MDATSQRRIEDLESVIEHLDTLYDDEQDCILPPDAPEWIVKEFSLGRVDIVSDQKYDMMRETLKRLSPRSRIFASVTASKRKLVGKKVIHNPPLCSLHKSNHELYWVKVGRFLKWQIAATAAICQFRKKAQTVTIKVPIEKLSEKERDIFKKENLPTSAEYVIGAQEVELKYDGVCIALYYKDGVLIKAGNRSRDGHGEDITENVKHIPSIPQRLKLPVTCRITGEVICKKEDFLKVQAALKAKGEDVKANPRNHASGALRQFLNPAKTAEGRLFFIGHGIDSLNNPPYRTGEERAKWANKELGIRFSRVSPFTFEKLAELEQLVPDLEYEVDGAVVSVADLSIVEEMGHIGDRPTGDPRGKEAWKFAEESAKPIIQHIEWSVGRTGTITPVAKFDAVKLAGTQVRKASLHNIGFMFRKAIDVGSQVVVLKSGKIIPKVVDVVKPHKGDVSYPKKCPCCGCKTTLCTSSGDEEMYELVCSNSSCPARIVNQFDNFLKVLRILGLGESGLEMLVSSGAVKEYSDFFNLTTDRVISCGFSKREALIVVASIQGVTKPDAYEDEELEDAIVKATKRKVPLSQFLTALGIEGVGQNTGKSLANHYGTLGAVLSASVEDLQTVEDVGGVTAKIIHTYLTQNRIAVLRLAEHIEPMMPKVGKFTGTMFCLTGGFPQGKKSVEEQIEKLGGRCVGSVSKKVNYVVVGENAGMKEQKAADLGIPRISLDQLEKML